LEPGFLELFRELEREHELLACRGQGGDEVSDDLAPVSRVVGEHAVVASEVEVRWRDQGGES
jgi:hypothetical protein